MNVKFQTFPGGGGGGSCPQIPPDPLQCNGMLCMPQIFQSPPTLKMLSMCVCVCVCGKQGGKNHLTSKHVENLQHKLPSVRFTQPHPIFF